MLPECHSWIITLVELGVGLTLNLVNTENYLCNFTGTWTILENIRFIGNVAYGNGGGISADGSKVSGTNIL
jgi:predicted outer membrane repeat protein